MACNEDNCLTVGTICSFSYKIHFLDMLEKMIYCNAQESEIRLQFD